ncbi:MAG TPA: ATP-binding cassette domain-containing protein [Plantibacter sp.]|nr:ATP-binding cassette domain-containing protein [Plantibacter sp.]
MPLRNETGVDGPSLSVELVTKGYALPGPMRVRRFFARLGGLQLDELGEEFPEDDDEDFLEDDDDEEQIDRGGLGRTVVDRVSFEAQPGSRIALVGQEGAGKTLLLKLIAGIVDPSEGRIVARGLVAPALTILAGSLPKGERIGGALPHVAAISGVSPSLVRSRLDEIADFLEFPQLRKAPTNVLEKRRKAEIVLATMLCIEPDIIVTDIPFGQSAFAERCVRRLDELCARGTILIAEARSARSLVPLPERVLVLDRGRLVADQPFDPATEKQRQAAG